MKSLRVKLHKIDERNAEIDTLISKIEGLVMNNRFEEALQDYLLLLEKYHESVNCFEDIVRGIGVGLCARLREINTGASWTMLSMVYGYGYVEAEYNKEEAKACACKAADMGSAYGAGMLGYLTDDNDERRRCFIRAAEMGCRVACVTVGIHLFRRFELDRACRFYLMAGSYRGCRERALDLIQDYPHEVTPWGKWRCTNPIVLNMVMEPVFIAQRCWMLCAKRLGVNHYVALIVADFICTKSGWK